MPLLLRHLALAALILALVSACGPLGDDDDEDPTATAAIPAGEASTTQGSDGTPAATPVSTPRAQAGPGTPRAGAAPTRAPQSDDEESDTDSGTPASDDESIGDASDESPQADDEDAEPTEAEEPDPTTVVVSDCEEPEELPERTGRQNRVVAADDGLILRSGPGTSCDEITSLAIDTPVRVISGVVDAEDDDVDWVKVDVDGDEGWVAAEFLENPPED